MKLIPYHYTFAEQVMTWQLDPKNRRFFRDFDRLLTLQELEELPRYLDEVFMVEENGKIIGMTFCKNMRHGVFTFGVLVDPEVQNKGRGTWIAKEIEKYIFEVRNGRKIMFMVAKDANLCRVSEQDLGYALVGSLKQHTYVNGKYEDLFIYEKVR